MADRISRQQGTMSDYVARNTRALRRHAAAPGGVTGIVTCHATPSATVNEGSTYNLSAGWSITDEVGNSGVTIVSGAPSYSPGVYLAQVLVDLSFPSDGTEDDPHTILVGEYVVGNVKFLAGSNDGGWDYSASGSYYVTSATASAMSVKYQHAPAGASGTPPTMGLSGAYLFVTRLGNVPA